MSAFMVGVGWMEMAARASERHARDGGRGSTIGSHGRSRTSRASAAAAPHVYPASAHFYQLWDQMEDTLAREEVLLSDPTPDWYTPAQKWKPRAPCGCSRCSHYWTLIKAAQERHQ